jgi:predicted transcriptional regulator
MRHSLASIRPKYVDLLLNGTKTVELRRRKVNIPDNSILWVYSTLPIGVVIAVANVVRVYHGSPNAVWKKFSMRIGLSKSEFMSYTENARCVTAIDIKSIFRLKRTVPLEEIRALSASFQPPQSIVTIRGDDPVLGMLTKELPDHWRS